MAKVYLQSLSKLNKLPESVLKLSIARKPIDNMEKYKLKHELKLAPSSYLLFKYKKKMISWDEFEYEFNKELNQNMDILEKIKYFVDNNINIALICYCGDFEYCHRKIIGERLTKMGITVEID